MQSSPAMTASQAKDQGSPSDTAQPAGIDRRFVLADGRRISYRVFGAAHGFPVLALHGTPGSRLKYAVADAAAAALGLRLISPDRWGYGGTDPHPRPTLVRYAEDMAELAGNLGLSRFSVVGISGGGPFAVAVAAELSERVGALALVAPVGPIADTPAERALDPFHRFCFRVVPYAPGAVRFGFAIFRGVLAVSTSAALRLAAGRAGPVDRRVVCDPEVRTRLGETFRVGLRPGVGGTVTDMRLFAEPWDVRLDRIAAQTRIWLGTEDRHVPRPAVHQLADTIPRAELCRLDGHGHFWISHHYADVLAWLAQSGGAQA